MNARQRGYSLVALLASVTIMLVMMAAAVPAWKYVVKNDREEELISRGGQIADAIRRFQLKNGNALPPSIDALVKGKYLRKAYKDPMTKDGKWRLIRQGETFAAGAGGARPPGNAPGSTPGGVLGGAASPAPSATPLPALPGQQTAAPLGAAGGTGPSGGGIGTFVGVASVNNEKSLRLFNNRQAYNEWWFMAGQPRVVGKRNVGGLQGGQPGGVGQPPQPGGGRGQQQQPLQPRPNQP